MVWILTVFIYLAPTEVKMVQVELSSPQQCQGAAQIVAETAARNGALGFRVAGCDFAGQEV